MKYKTLNKPEIEYRYLLQMVLAAHPDSSNTNWNVGGGQIVAVTGDFEPTQVIADARWLAVLSYSGSSLIMIDSIGDMITIIPE